MTVYIPFVPTTDQPFQFNATFDGSSYNVITTVNFFRLPQPAYYINVYSSSGDLIFAMPLIASPTRRQVPLTTYQGNYIATLDSADPYINTGTVIISVNAAPGTIVGLRSGLSIALDPSPAIATDTDGSALFSNDVNLLAGYFKVSTLVYRAATGNFEVDTYPPLPASVQQLTASPTYVPAVGQPTPPLPPTSIFPPVPLPGV
jgi:hypothetical protein